MEIGIYISKIDVEGNFIWARAMGSSGKDEAMSITTDDLGNVYSTGYFNDSVDFDPGSGVHHLFSSGSDDVYILKLDSSGTFMWAKSIGGTSSDNTKGITTDALGNVYTTGFFQDNVDFDPGIDSTIMSSQGSMDVFVLKLDSIGDFIWVKTMGGASVDVAESITTDAFGNIFTTGYFMGSVDFDPGIGTFNKTSSGGLDVFITKLDPSGNFIWAKTMGGSGGDLVHCIKTDSIGNVYTSGSFRATGDFDPGIGTHNLVSKGIWDLFVLKLDSSGNFIWAESFGQSLNDHATSLEISSAGNLYVTGYYGGVVDFDPDSSINNLISKGGYDVFALNLDASGNFIWAKSMGGPLNDYGSSILSDGIGNVYLAGNYMATADFDPGNSTYNLSSNGDSDGFIIKLSQCAVLATISAQSNVLCKGDSTGSATVTPGNGSLPYSYAWSNGQNTSTATNLAAGTYYVTITESGGSKQVVSVKITESTLLVANITAQTHVAVNGGNTGKATVTVSGGTEPYSFYWTNGQTTESATNLNRGLHGVTVTDSLGCVSTTSCILMDPPVGVNLACTSVDLEWVKSMEGNSGIDKATALTKDPSGNVYTSGFFSGTVDFDPGPGVSNLISSNGERYIAKFDSIGNLLWARSFGGVMNDYETILSTNENGDVYIAGRFYLTADFDPGAGVYNLTSNGGAHLFILKLNSAGNFVWAKSAIGTLNGVPTSINIDPFGNVYTIGFFSGTVDFDPGIGLHNLVAGTTYDIFIWKLDSAGSFIWAESFGGAINSDFGSSITTDSIGNVFATGYFRNIVDFDPGSGIYNLNALGYLGMFILKLNSSGSFVWAKVVSGSVRSSSITTDVYGNVYTTGIFSSIADFDPGLGVQNISTWRVDNVFILKLDRLGNYVWAKALSSSLDMAASMINVDLTGNVYTSGYFMGNADFNPGVGTQNAVSNGGSDVFVSKLDDMGNFVWAQTMGGSSNDRITSSTIDDYGNIYATGYFRDTVDFDPGVDTSHVISNGLDDAFILKLSQCLFSSNVALQTNVGCNGDSTGSATVFASGASGTFAYVWSDGQTTATASSLGAGTYTVTVTENVGSIETHSVTITEPSVITSSPFESTSVSCPFNSSGVGAVLVSGGTPGYSFLWSNGVTDSLVINFTSGTHYVTITDSNSCTHVDSITINDSDLVPPVVVTQNIFAPLNAIGRVTVTADQIDSGSFDNCGIDSMYLDMDQFTCGQLGANTVMLTVVDLNGNSATGTAIVTVQDIISPTILTQNDTVYLNPSGTASITMADINNGTTDNCGVQSLGLSMTSFTCANLGSNTVTLTVSDSSSNTSSGTAMVTVLDTISPTAISQNVSVYLDGNGSVYLPASDVNNGSFDNCSILIYTLDTASFYCSDVGVNNVLLTATDASGNWNTTLATITVIDTFSLTARTQDITVYLDALGQASITASDIDNGSGDNCITSTISVNQTNFDCNDLGLNTVTLTVTDANSNTANGTATVTVIDNISPSVVIQNITVYLDTNGNASIVALDVDNGSTDNCGIQNLSMSTMMFGCTDLGSNTVTLTVTDSSLNISTSTAIITVLDTIVPSAVSQNLSVYLDANGLAIISGSDVDNGSSDNCSVLSYTLDVTNFDCSKLGVNAVVLTVTDVSGNNDTSSAIITVIDIISPTVIAQDITVYLDANGLTSITAANVDNGTTDNCLIDSVYLKTYMMTCSEIGIQVGWLYVIDMSGNVDSSAFLVDVLDTLPPTVVCPNDTVICEGRFYFNDPSGINNCNATVIQTSGFISGDYLIQGNYTFNYEVSDFSTNTDSCTYNVEVNPIPVVSLGSDITVGAGSTVPFTNVSDTLNEFLWSDGSTDSILMANIYFDSTIWVNVSDTNGCMSSDTVEITVLLGMENGMKEAVISLYPNPAHNEIQIKVQNWSALEIEITFMALNGKVIKTHSITNPSTQELVKFDTEILARGVYLVRVSDGTNQSVTRVVLQ